MSFINPVMSTQAAGSERNDGILTKGIESGSRRVRC